MEKITQLIKQVDQMLAWSNLTPDQRAQLEAHRDELRGLLETAQVTLPSIDALLADWVDEDH